MGFFGTILGVLGFGFPFGLFMGFYLFIYSESNDVEDPVIKELSEVDGDELEDLMPEIPLWMKSPNYDRVDWLNQLLSRMWPFLDKEICSIIRSTAEPMFAEYIGKFKIETIEFDTLTLGNLPPVIQGLKVIETNEELVMEPAVRWAGNPNITVAVTIASVRVTILGEVILCNEDKQGTWTNARKGWDLFATVIFSHVQLYVVLSGARRSSAIRVLIRRHTVDSDDHTNTRNVVYT